MKWIKNLSTITLVFNISQFFSSLNYYLLLWILGKTGSDPKVIQFFSNYLISRKTWYFWNSFSLQFFNVNIGMGQGSVLSSILSVIYLAPTLHILENHLQILKISVSILYFIDNGLLIAQSKSFSISNSLLCCSYNIISNLLTNFGLVTEQSKTEVFHFSRSIGNFNPPPLDLSALRGPILYPKETW